jgi:hypothetical protein
METVATTMKELFGDVIYSYTRAQAIEDGYFVDLSAHFPKECRMYRYPVACTTAVWSLVEQSVADERHCNSLAGVVWDILYMSQRGVVSRPDDQTAIFQVIITGTGRNNTHTLKIVCGPGDEGEPVMTIMLPEED